MLGKGISTTLPVWGPGVLFTRLSLICTPKWFAWRHAALIDHAWGGNVYVIKGNRFSTTLLTVREILNSEVLNKRIHVVLQADQALNASKVPSNPQEQNKWIFLNHYIRNKSWNQEQPVLISLSVFSPVWYTYINVPWKTLELTKTPYDFVLLYPAALFSHLQLSERLPMYVFNEELLCLLCK